MQVLLANELGGALGHVTVLGALARRLVDAGHHVVAAVPNAATARPWFPRSVELRQRPPLPSLARRAHRTLPELFADNGWGDPGSLAHHLGWWRDLLDDVQPDGVVVDSAPTVVLALHGSKTPCIGTGTPFFAPPRARPLPGLRIWDDLPEAPRRAIEQRLVQQVNRVRPPGSPWLPDLASLFASVHWMLQGPRELDPFAAHRSEQDEHLGHLGALGAGDLLPFPPGDGPRIFAYLKPSYPGVDLLLEQLRQRGRVLAYVPGRASLRPGIRVVPHPIDLSHIRPSTDLAVTHSVLGTGSAFLARGVPCLFVPMHLEQLAIAWRASQLDGVVSMPPGALPALREAVGRSLDPSQRPAAQRTARLFREDGLQRLVGRVEAHGV